MRVALEAGEVLEVAVLDGDKVVGTLSLKLNGLGSAKRPGRPSASESAGASTTGTKKRRQRKPMSAETRARMAEAQKARWAKRNAEANQGGESA